MNHMFGHSARGCQPGRRQVVLGALCAALLSATPGCQKGAQPEILGTLPEFSLKDQDGQVGGSKQLAGTPYLAAFMFTRCPTVCPRVTAKMREIAGAAERANLPLRLVSISVDGGYDTPEVLARYAEKHHLTKARHILLTGPSAGIAQVAEQHFKIAVSGSIDEAKEHLGISHGSHLILVDAAGRIRGYYGSSDEETTSRVIADVRRL